ncbi:YjbH domain-containing protein [Ramlibacter alkalitolerans]|uniref:YjbH domain-containing protein n=1 Tax=Ramlibacter alkalitolerans TaxID=2039631 RepID=A0ABS1JY49_9BURK|nr:YjbH domain-containing protein [Ramlibacter alkalitolerans]MBL0428686.1 YjbH domain-containing protein [Ramlibacter alkalitolerans]
MRSCLALVLGATTSACLAQSPQTTMTQAGFTGLSITPSAHILGWGRMEFSYDNQLPGNVRDPSGHNYVLGVGLLPNLEIAGRLAANSPLDANCFVAPGCGTRDLSASAKAGIALDRAQRYHIAAGITDVGGSVTHFRSVYGVLTYNQGPWEASGGYARRSGGVNGSRSPLDGIFLAGAWQPLPWARGQLEFTDRKAWAGVRLFAPKEWLPEGWSAYVGANRRLTDTNLTEKSWFSAGIAIPLYKVPNLPASSVNPSAVAPAPQQPPTIAAPRTSPPASVLESSPAPARPAPAPRVDDARLFELAAALRNRGLEDLWVGRMDDGSIAVRANNATYNWNSLDALGVALAAVADTLGSNATVYRLILTQRQLPLVAVTGQADCLRRWIQDATAACTAGQLTTPGSAVLDRMHFGADWVVRREQASIETVRMRISPILQKNVGSELGALDYSLGANIGVELPLWDGARVEAGYDVPITETSDFKNGGVFSDRRVRSRLDRLAFTQTLRLPFEQWITGADDAMIQRWGLGNVVAQGSVGQFGGFYTGVHGAVRWEPGAGRHRVSAEAGLFEHSDFGSPGTPGVRSPRPLIAEYRYNFAPTRTYFEATAGNFMNNDLGYQLGLRQWFNDVAVHVYYKRTRLEHEPSRQFVGLELTFPLGPRKDMNPRGFQVTGTPRFALGVETTVRETGLNPVRVGHGVVPPVASVEETFNSDRSGLVYFEDNVGRIRDVAAQAVRRAGAP